MELRKRRMILQLVRFYSTRSRFTRVTFLTLVFGSLWTAFYMHHIQKVADIQHQVEAKNVPVPYKSEVLSQMLQDLYQDTTEFRLPSSHHCLKVQPWIVIFVFSAPGNQEQRNAIRKTWKDKSLYHPKSMVSVLFLLGASKDKTEQLFIDDESNYFSDIVQDTSFVDSPLSTGYKSVSMLKWIALHCPDIKLVMKVDDSCIVIPDSLSEWMTYSNLTQSWPSYSILGQIHSCPHPSRHSGSQWFISEQEWPGNRFCDKSTSADSYMITGDAILALLQASQEANFLKYGDIYMTGVLAEQARLNYQSISHYAIHQYQGRITLLQLMFNSDIFTVCGLTNVGAHDNLWQWCTTPKSAYTYFYLLYGLLSFLAVALWCLWSAVRLLRHFGLIY